MARVSVFPSYGATVARSRDLQSSLEALEPCSLAQVARLQCPPGGLYRGLSFGTTPTSSSRCNRPSEDQAATPLVMLAHSRLGKSDMVLDLPVLRNPLNRGLSSLPHCTGCRCFQSTCAEHNTRAHREHPAAQAENSESDIGRGVGHELYGITLSLCAKN